MFGTLREACHLMRSRSLLGIKSAPTERRCVELGKAKSSNRMWSRATGRCHCHSSIWP